MTTTETKLKELIEYRMNNGIPLNRIDDDFDAVIDSRVGELKAENEALRGMIERLNHKIRRKKQ